MGNSRCRPSTDSILAHELGPEGLLHRRIGKTVRSKLVMLLILTWLVMSISRDYHPEIVQSCSYIGKLHPETLTRDALNFHQRKSRIPCDLG